MTEYFVVANSFAAPWFSDTNEEYVSGNTPEEALLSFVKNYKHPCGLFAAVLYASADDMHKGKKSLCKWLCNQEIKKMEVTKDLGGYTYCGHGGGKFEVDGKMYEVENYKQGAIVK